MDDEQRQTVYRVTVEDGAGDVRRGWVRCGGFMVGLWSDKVQVKWDNEARPGFPVTVPGERRDA